MPGVGALIIIIPWISHIGVFSSFYRKITYLDFRRFFAPE